MRCYRRRQRYALLQLRIETDVAVVDRLVERGFLKEHDANDRAAIESALSRAVATLLVHAI